MRKQFKKGLIPYLKNNFMKFRFLLFSLFFSVISLAQEHIKIDKKVFKKEITSKADKKAFKSAWNEIEQGEYYFSLFSKGAYAEALKHYLKASQYNKETSSLNYKIGACYSVSNEKTKAIPYLEKALNKNENIAQDILFLLAKSYQFNYEFEKAINYFEKYQNTLDDRNFKKIGKIIEKKVFECQNGIKLIKEPVRVFIDNIGQKINSKNDDYCPFISADESILFFTSRRADTKGGNMASDGRFFEDIYISNNENGKWTEAKNIGKPLSSEDNDATVGLSNDGQSLFIFNGEKKGGDIFICRLKGDKWSKPKSLKGINTSSHEEYISFSPDEKTLYFVSNHEKNNLGQHDIFKTTLNKKGKWGKPENLSPVINTEYDERSVFMHPDGRTIYFSSTGHTSMGGFDIFKSVMDNNGNWSKPENLGYPINTTGNDIFFVMAGNGRKAYYSSEKKEGFGGQDIYTISFLGKEKPIIQSNEDNLLACMEKSITEIIFEEKIQIQTARLTILKGIITDEETNLPLEATIEIVDNDKNEPIASFQSNSKTGKYLISLPSGKNYGIAIKAENYLFHSENFNIPETSNYQEIVKNVALKKLKKGSKIVLRNVFFDTAKSSLRPASETELNRLIKILNDHPKIKIEISGHTDNVGSLAYNKKLSKNRAKSVVNYLIKNGIDKQRLTFEGYAYNQAIATNDTDEGRQLNRRVEYEIVED